jgi:Transcriptional regulator
LRRDCVNQRKWRRKRRWHRPRGGAGIHARGPNNNDRSRREPSILNAAIAEFAERGFEGASIRAIADRLGLQHPLITYHFRTKDILWRAAAEHAFAQIKAGWDISAPKTPICRRSPDCESNTLRSFVTLSRFLNFIGSCVKKR